VVSITIELAATVYAPGRAREAVREAAEDAAVHEDERWRAEMIITELVTNAVRHGPGGPVEVAIEAGRDRMRGEVADPGTGFRKYQVTSRRAYDEGGRGLFLVDALSDSWGLSDDSSRVWFEVSAQA
jgi:anti-sigma regulatory factor (Ser/Thr protein kinase)